MPIAQRQIKSPSMPGKRKRNLALPKFNSKLAKENSLHMRASTNMGQIITTRPTQPKTTATKHTRLRLLVPASRSPSIAPKGKHSVANAWRHVPNNALGNKINSLRNKRITDIYTKLPKLLAEILLVVKFMMPCCQG